MSQFAQLKDFIELCKAQLATGDGTTNEDETVDNAQPSLGEETEPESDVELNMEGVIEGDPIDNDQHMGEEGKIPSDEDCDQSDEKRTEAMKAFSEQNFDKAIKLYTEAIQLNPKSAPLFAKRGQVYLKLNKPNACIKDCTHALELNCDSAAAYKFRGCAYRLLGKFEEASHDLCESLKINYDDQTNGWLNDVKPNAEKLRQHKLSAQRKREEKEQREKLRRLRKGGSEKARSNAAKTQAKAQAGPNNLELHQIPELLSILEDPEVMNAYTDMSQNPHNLYKYYDNPKIAASFIKLQKFSGLPKFTNFPVFCEEEFGAGEPAAPPKPTDDDVGLD